VSAPGVAAPGGDRLPGISARTERLVWLGVAFLVLLLIGTAATRVQATVTLGAITTGLVVVASRRFLLAWPTLLGTIILVILFIPVRRYTLGGGFPFQLEPYRVLIAGVAFMWLSSLAIDPQTRFRRTGLEAPLILFAVAIVASLATNLGRASSLSGDVIRMVSVWAGFFCLMYLAAGTIKTRKQLDVMLMLLVGGGAIVAVCALFEWKNGRNLFNDLERFVPLLDLNQGAISESLERGGAVRAYASSQHAIALGAMLVMMLPLALYLFKRTNRKEWLGCALLLVMGALATTSRTAIVMLIVCFAVFLWLKRADTIRMLPLLLPLVVVLQVAMPGSLGTMKAIFFPKEGLVQEEQEGEGTGTGRVADLGPSLEEWGRQPVFGQGFGTRLTSHFDHVTNARILDDQWLSSLLETGAVGVGALLWLIIRAIRRLKLLAKNDDSDYGWLMTALCAAIYAFAVGMLTYDAFSFIQVTFFLFLLLGLSSVAIALKGRETAE
jgi:O-antigen ligase/polysaccharide polymerase Wzy-like membrane protein